MSNLDPLRLRKAARLWGIQPSYRGMDQKVVWAGEYTLCAVLEAITGARPHTNDDLDDLIERARGEWIESVLPPSLVVRANHEGTCTLHVLETSAAAAEQALKYELTDEHGSVVHRGEWSGFDPKGSRTRPTRSGCYRRLLCRLPALELGYYTLRVWNERGDIEGESLVISTPTRDPELHSGQSRGRPSQSNGSPKNWGIFSPLYALRRHGDCGLGDLSHVRRLQSYAKEWKCRWIGLLPLLSKAGMMESDQISPYSPQSRLFWNEIFLDMEELLEYEEHLQPGVRTAFAADDLEALFTPATDLRLVDYASVFQRKRRVLLVLSERFFRNNQDPEYPKFLNERPELADFAEIYSESEAEFRYYLYSQYQMHRQMTKLKAASQSSGYGGLYLDLPVGVQKDGFDFKRYSNLFVESLEVGSPPDMLFHAGQRWGFPPYHPHELRKSGYSYYRKMIRNHFEYADALRIDHVMGLYRIFVIPEGMEAKDGCYIRLPFRELFAITRIEADLHNAVVIGEDLGTVPEAVRETMDEFQILRMWVVQIELLEKGVEARLNPPENCVASVNTHDMPPWQAFQSAQDIQLWRELGYFAPEISRAETRKRQKVIQKFSRSPWNQGDLFRSMIEELAKSDARTLILNLEDLWSEDQPQNVPGTWREYPNWRLRHRWAMEEWMEFPEVQRIFQMMAEVRS